MSCGCGRMQGRVRVYKSETVQLPSHTQNGDDCDGPRCAVLLATTCAHAGRCSCNSTACTAPRCPCVSHWLPAGDCCWPLIIPSHWADLICHSVQKRYSSAGKLRPHASNTPIAYALIAWCSDHPYRVPCGLNSPVNSRLLTDSFRLHRHQCLVEVCAACEDDCNNAKVLFWICVYMYNRRTRMMWLACRQLQHTDWEATNMTGAGHHT